MLKAVKKMQLSFVLPVLLSVLIVAYFYIIPLGNPFVPGSKTIHHLLLIGIVILCAALSAVILCSFRRGLRAERLFLCVFIPLSLLAFAAIPPMNVPDESAHFSRCFAVSTGQLLPAANISMPDNILAPFSEGMADNMLTWQEIASHLSSAVSPVSDLLESPLNTGIYPTVCYLPQGVFIAVGRVFSSNIIFLFYCGRFGAWLVTLLLMFAAIRKAPEAVKYLFMLFFLLPMTLQESISLSADGMTIGTIACLTAYVLHAQDHSLNRRELVFLSLLCILSVQMKVMYFPFAFLILLVPARAFASRRSRTVWTACTLGLSIGLLILWCMLCVTGFSSTLSHTGDFYSGSKITLQLEFMLRQPRQFVEALLRTLCNLPGHYLNQLIGSSLGQYNASLPSAVYCTLLACLFIAIGISIRGRSHQPLRLKAPMHLLTFLCFLLIYIFLYVWFTPYMNGYIEGVQGRYFIPLLFPLLGAVDLSGQSRFGSTCFDQRLICLWVNAAACGLGCVFALLLLS